MVRLFTERLLRSFLTSPSSATKLPWGRGEGKLHSASVDYLVPRLDLRRGVLDLGILGRNGFVSQNGEQGEFMNGEDARDDSSTSDKRCLRRKNVRGKCTWS